jgi:CheY-like chemotaxis protein
MVKKGRRRTILLVEDDADTRRAIREALREEGFQVREATQGREALETLRKTKMICLILLDMLMPEMDGWKFYEELQRDPKLSRIPVVLVTVVKDPRLPVETLIKPIRLGDLVGVVRRNCGIKGTA